MAFSTRRGPSSSRFFYGLLFVVLAIVGTTVFVLFFEMGKPVVNVEKVSDHIGRKGIINYSVRDTKSGLRSVTVSSSQGEVKKVLHAVTFPRTSSTGAIGPHEDASEVTFDTKTEGFKDGPMTITVEARDFSMWGWFSGNKTVVTKEVKVDTEPPRVELLHNEKYISPGGTGIAIYRLNDQEIVHGVSINGRLNPGFVLDEGNNEVYISYFALPYDAEKIEALAVKAVDKAGNETSVTFSSIFQKVAQKKDSISVSDSFLQEKLPEFQQHYPEMKGDSVAMYLFTNNEVRDRNNAKISELCRTPLPKRMWRGSFSRMAGSSRAGFADHRTYYYQDKAIDNQVHLGMDIASTQRAEVRAANSGQVAFAGYLGIYGNLILVDHGQGIFSLYSHLSQMNVAPGDTVDQKTVIGLTGITGMAGGDHLHFAMLVNGVFVTPKEWWDQHWVDVTIEEPIKDLKNLKP
ncbi:MAG TPA: peptidase M23 [Desulfobulbaceae bacterium]|nr:peptidase M23 [Desulfobulbaceae bacterium]